MQIPFDLPWLPSILILALWILVGSSYRMKLESCQEE